MYIINQENAPMQLNDFMVLPMDSQPEEEFLYVYSIKKQADSVELTTLENGKRYPMLRASVEKAKKLNPGDRAKGLYLEFGFGAGTTLNFIAAIANNSFVYGFDSCNGLGEDTDLQKCPFAYTKTVDTAALKMGTYYELGKAGELEPREKQLLEIPLKQRVSKDELPFIPFTPLCNVSLYIGEIRETLASFIKQEFGDKKRGQHVSFLFLDVNDPFLTIEIIALLADYLDPELSVLLSDHELTQTVIEKKTTDLSAVKQINAFTQKSLMPNLQQFIQWPPGSNDWAADEDGSIPEAGRNVLHFSSIDREHEFICNASMETLRQELALISDRAVNSDSEVLQYAIKDARERWQAELAKGEQLYFFEFGFCSGRSLNFIASLLNDNEHLFGFDSGKGLPHKWRYKFPEGTFRYTKRLKNTIDGNFVFQHIDFEKGNRVFDPKTFIPFIPHKKANLILGYVEDVLQSFIDEHLVGKEGRHVALLFIDTDLYTAATEILSKLSPYIINEKTVIVFDEAFNFIGNRNKGDKGEDSEWQHHEYKALKEFSKKAGRYGYRNLTYNQNGQQLMICFKNN